MFEGKTALVVGGVRGIGAATARLLSLEDANVIASYLRNDAAAEATERTIRDEGGRITFLKSDAHDGVEVQELVRRAYESRDRLDIVVAAAPGAGSCRTESP